MKTQITELVEKLRASGEDAGPHCDLSSSSVKSVKAPIPTELYDQLKTMGLIYQQDLNCIAGELLEVALKEALECLTDEELDQIETVRKAVAQEEAQRHMEEQRYDAGCT